MNSILSRIFSRSTEPSYSGLRVIKQRHGDDSPLIRLTNPQERFRKYVSGVTDDDQLLFDRLKPLTDYEKQVKMLEPPPFGSSDRGGDPSFSMPEDGERNGKIQGAITGAGSILASMFAQDEQPTELNFAEMRSLPFLPIQDSRYLPRRAKGGAVRKGQPYIVGEEGAEIVIPEEDGEVIANDDSRFIRLSNRQKDGEVVANDEITTTTPVMGTKILPREAIPLPDKPMREDVTEPSPAEALMAQIKRHQRPYTKTKQEDGMTEYSENYDRKRNWKDVLRSAGYGVLKSLATAPPTNDLGALLGRAIGGGGTGAVLGATMDNVDEKMRDEFKLGQLIPQYKEAYGIEQQREKDALDREYRQGQINTIKRDDERQEQAAWNLAEWRKSETSRKISDSQARERTARMRTVQSMLKDLPEFMPGDPKYKEIEAALGDLGLPITQKDAKKKIDLKQDQRTGAWTVILTNPVSGIQESRSVLKDGKPFVSTPTVVMQGEYGLLKQDNQQDFTERENEKARQQQVLMQQMRAKDNEAADLRRFTNDAEKQKRAAEIDKEILVLRQQYDAAKRNGNQ